MMRIVLYVLLFIAFCIVMWLGAQDIMTEKADEPVPADQMTQEESCEANGGTMTPNKAGAMVCVRP